MVALVENSKIAGMTALPNAISGDSLMALWGITPLFSSRIKVAKTHWITAPVIAEKST